MFPLLLPTMLILAYTHFAPKFHSVKLNSSPLRPDTVMALAPTLGGDLKRVKSPVTMTKVVSRTARGWFRAESNGELNSEES
jgi:hypothetical protein